MHGKADVVMTGGAEAAIHPMPIASFAPMQALSRRNDDPEHASRPYDIDRDGFVMGEGAGALVLEAEEHALARGARIYAELCRLAASPPTRTTSRRRTLRDWVPPAPLKAAMFDAPASADDVVHVNAHATSTPVGDKPEYTACRPRSATTCTTWPVSATKSQTGHLLGASGAVESVMTVLAIYERRLPVTINLDNQDPEIPLDVVTSAREPARTGDISR